MLRIGFLHTAHVHVTTFDALLHELDASARGLHRVEPDLLDLARGGTASATVSRDTLVTLKALADDGAAVIVCTCSTLGPVAEALGTDMPVPVLRVDRPMARAAVQAGSRIGVVAALESTLEPTRALLADESRLAGMSPSIVEVVVPQAWAAFESGNLDDYLAQIADATRAIADSVDVVVLAQASMMGALATLADLPIPVLTSPPLAVRQALSASEVV